MSDARLCTCHVPPRPLREHPDAAVVAVRRLVAALLFVVLGAYVVPASAATPTYYGNIIHPTQWQTYHVADYGACAPGATVAQQNAAVQAAVTAASARANGFLGSKVLLTDGCAPNINATILVNPPYGNVLIDGGGGYLQVDAALVGDVFRVPYTSLGKDIEIVNLNITARGATRSSGAIFNFQNCDSCTVRDISWQGATWWDFLDVGYDVGGNTGSVNRTLVDNARNAGAGFAGCGVRVNGGLGNFSLTNSPMSGTGIGGTSVAVCASDAPLVHATNWDSWQFINDDFENTGSGLLFSVGAISNSVINNIWLTNVTCGGAQTGPCVSFVTTSATARAENLFISTPWFYESSTTQNVVQVSAFTGSTLDTVRISGGGFLAGGLNGLSVGSNVGNVSLNHVAVSQATNCGISDGGYYTSISASPIGPVRNNGVVYPANKYGICELAPAVGANYFGNNLTGNTTNAFTSASGAAGGSVLDNDMSGYATPTVISAGSSHVLIANNPGYNPVGAMTALTVGASPYTYTNTTAINQTIYVSGGTVSAISAGGVVTGLTSGTFSVPPGKTLVITHTGAPSATVSGN